jgi:predicted 2-oxoglutarate/Fe(II)-dependent dioxygenase YbiX
MDHLESVVEIKSIINPQFIENILPFVKKRSKQNLHVAGGVRTDIRNVEGYHLKMDGTPTDLFYWNYIKAEITRLYTYYKGKFPLMINSKINQIDLLKYRVGGKYNVHTDHFAKGPRHVSVIMNLNDDYEGGDLVFTDQKEKEIKRLKLTKGSIVFFPSNFMYPHGIQPITKGTRYSIVSWLQ